MDEHLENQNPSENPVGPENQNIPENVAPAENQPVQEGVTPAEAGSTAASEGAASTTAAGSVNAAGDAASAAPKAAENVNAETPQSTPESGNAASGSVYSYSRKDLDRSSREGNYNARRDSNESIFAEEDSAADSSWGAGSGIYGGRNASAAGGVYGSRQAQNTAEGGRNGQAGGGNTAGPESAGSQGQNRTAGQNPGGDPGRNSYGPGAGGSDRGAAGQSQGGYRGGGSMGQGGPQHGPGPQRGSYRGPQGGNPNGAPNGRGNDNSGQNQKYSYRPNGDGNYREAEPERKERKIYERPKRKPGLGSGGSFGQALAKCLCFAIIFGLVAGGIIYGMNRKTVLAIQQAAIERENAASEESKDSTEKSNSGSTDSSESKSDPAPAASSDSDSASVIAVDLTDMVEDVMPSVVSISNVSEQEYYDFFGRSQTYEAQGVASGIIVAEDDSSYFIATNNHVVAGSTSLTVTFCDDTVVSGEIKGTAANNDLAVVIIAKKELTDETKGKIKVAKLGDSSQLKVGQTAVAIGNALGYGQSVTVGVISALNRQVTSTDQTNGMTYSASLIQTDAAINPGNSGGALLNIYGEVIGINSSKYSDTDVEGMGYAIPISTAQPIIDDLIHREEVSESERAFLGITGADVDSSSAATYGMPVGIFITQVYEDTAAAAGGLQKGDILTGFNGKIVATMDELQNEILYCKAGDKATITFQRRGDNGEYTENTVEVTLGERPEGQ